MLTRRAALKLSFAIPAGMLSTPAFSFGSKDFWETKPSTEWSSAEVDRMLTRSPWAKDGVIYSNGQQDGFGGNGGGNRRSRGSIGLPGGIGFPGGGIGLPGSGGGPMGTPGPSNPPGDIRESFQATVRWDSALPVQEALRIGSTDNKPNTDLEKYYVIRLLGDLPMLGGPRNSSPDDDDPAQNQRREEMFKQYTKLERKGGDLQPEKVVPGSRFSSSGSGVLFYFSRADEISLDDKQISFFTKMGPVEVRAKFVLKDMFYHGKLAL